ncbi:DUF58 domain-containing protein [Candidatus Poriferisocius sp.]|uniref:DUF58 domain-containing protein n=1 Tax=Candidatus Poriferisocius sp. TaxID=3101276 RepID=UPI003B5B933D
MLHPPGKLLLLGSALLAGAGRVFGSVELSAVGVAGIAVVICSFAYVRIRRPLKLDNRSLRPQPVHVGQECHVSLELTNAGRRRTPVLRLADPVTRATHDPTGNGPAAGNAAGNPTTASAQPGLDLLVAPVPSGDPLPVTYRLPTHERGLVTVGPLTCTVSDPWSLAARQVELGGRSQALVYPAVFSVPPPPHLAARSSDAVRRSPIAQSGEELYGLRPFQTGDDPRRIHWRLSAHHDELIVRQFEEFSEINTTVVLDTRRAQLDAEGGAERFEAMVSAAAGICRAGRRRGDHIRLTTPADFDSGFGKGHTHLHLIYEHLALVTPGDGTLVGAVERLSRQPGGQVVVVAAMVDGTEAGVLAPLGALYSSKTVVVFTDANTDGDGYAGGDGDGDAGGKPTPTPAPAATDVPHFGGFSDTSLTATSLVVVSEPQRFPEVWTAHADAQSESRSPVGLPMAPAMGSSPVGPPGRRR